MASHDFNKSWESITKIHPLVENDDGTVQCGKCATGYEESHEAEECCETCWKCGLRGHNMPDEAEDCCPCSCGGEHGFCETSDVSDEIEQEIFESLAADGAARAKMQAMFGKPPKGMEDYFRRSWDSITKNQPSPPDYFIDAHPASSGVDIGELMADMTSPEIDIKEVGGEGDECCATLRTEAQRIYDRFKGTPAEVVLQDEYVHSIEEDCETDLVPAIKSSISYVEHLIDEHNRDSLDPDAKVMLEGQDPDWALRMDELLEDLKQMILEYESCNMISDTGGFEDVTCDDEQTGFYASADPFEFAWDSIRKESAIRGD